MVIWSQVVMPVRLALASTTWKLGWGIFNRQNGEFSTGLDKGLDRCQRYCSPAALAPPVPVALLGDDAVFSTAATKRPGAATGPSG